MASTPFCLSGNLPANELIVCHCEELESVSTAMNAGAEAGTMSLAPAPICAVVPPQPAASNAVAARTPVSRRIICMLPNRPDAVTT